MRSGRPSLPAPMDFPCDGRPSPQRYISDPRIPTARTPQDPPFKVLPSNLGLSDWERDVLVSENGNTSYEEVSFAFRSSGLHAARRYSLPRLLNYSRQVSLPLADTFSDISLNRCSLWVLRDSASLPLFASDRFPFSFILWPSLPLPSPTLSWSFVSPVFGRPSSS